VLARNEGSKVQPNVTGEFRPGDNRHDFADNSKLRKAFATRGFTQLREGLQKLAEWSKDAEAKDLFDKEEKERKMYFSS
jgi:dTDP-L-rhamnose 4-epimerase